MKLSLKLAFAGLIALGAAGVSTAASAMPVAASTQTLLASPVEDVRFGCGPGWHPNRFGRCVPNRARFYAPRRRFYGHRRWRRW